jgi:hypothetical protein
MQYLKICRVPVLLAPLVGILSAGCSWLDGSSSSDGGIPPCAYGGASYGQPECTGAVGTDGSAAATCDQVLFDNGNIYACTNPTDTSVFTLTQAATVTSLRLWVNTTISGQTVTYTLLGPTGAVLSSGPTAKGSCDPYQTNWCAFMVSMNMTLAAGTYTVKSSAVATCANSGSNNVGMVAVQGCAGTAAPVDAAVADTARAPDLAAGDTAAATCDEVLFDNGNIYACTNPTDTSVFTLAQAATVTSLRLWVNTTISGQTVVYTLLGPTGAVLSSGPTTKGSCDPYQTNWCAFMVSMNMTLAAGTYTVKSSAVATCANSGSNNVGMVAVQGCAGTIAPPPDAAIADTAAPDVAAGDTAAATCDQVLFDNGNIYTCTNPTDTSVFTLAQAATVTSLRLWVNTTISGQTVAYVLLGPTGSTLSSGPTTKGGCDPYQTNWCEFLVSMNMTLAAGTYTVKSSAVATCANSGSNNVGMVAVKGCAGTTATSLDAAVTDAARDGSAIGSDAPAVVYSCGAFPLGSEWTTAAGFRSAIVAKDGLLTAPVALTFAGGAFGSGAYVVDQGTNQVLRLDEKTGTVTAFVSGTQWPKTPSLLTTILWDAALVFDGKLYIGDQGGDGDADSTVFRADAAGTAQVFLAAPGPGLDDIYGMVFSPGGSYPAGLYVSGDTDGSGPGFGVFGASGTGTTFAAFAGVEGLAVDTSGRFGGGLFASMPAGGGYSGDDSLTRIQPDGTKAAALVAGVPGIHAITFAPAGPFGGDAYVASWSSQKIMRIKPDGTISDLATGLSLTNYDGNILAFSPDGRVLFVADRSNHRIVCIEPAT